MKKFIAILLSIPFVFSACVFDSQSENIQVTYSDQYLDTQIFNEAVSSMDEASCQRILVGETRVECISAIQDIQKTHNAMTKKDEKLCDDVDSDRYREECNIQVERSLFYSDIQESREGIVDEAIAEGDAEICSGNPDQKGVDDCNLRVEMNKNPDGIDESFCDTLKDAQIEEICRKSVK